MNFDMTKRLCDCTLGEYLAAERSVGITTQWGAAIIATAFGFLVAKLLQRRRARKAQKLANSFPGAVPTGEPPSLISEPPRDP